MDRRPFPLKARKVILILFTAGLLSPGFDLLVLLFGSAEPAWYNIETTELLYYQVLWGLAIVLMARLSEIELREMLRPCSRDAYAGGLKLSAYVFFLTLSLFYLLYIPLSFALPDFVSGWVLDYVTLIYYDEGRFPLAANFLSVLNIVILAPIVEEIVFRGFLLHRWIEKWGTYRAILASSLLFGILHPDMVGAAIFGAAMCVIYLRTQTLLVPIVCHMAFNLVAFFLEVWAIAQRGPEYLYGIEELRSELYIGLICTVFVIGWTYSWMRRPSQPMPLFLPQLSCQQVKHTHSER